MVELVRSEPCPFCEKRPTKKGARTCGDARCRKEASRETRSLNDLDDQLAYMKSAYGKGNPWTQWLQQQINKAGRS